VEALPRGPFFWDRTGIDDRRKAAKLFEQALRYDSTQPVLYAFLSASIDDIRSPKAHSYLNKALQLDSTSPETNIMFSRLERMSLHFPRAVHSAEKALRNGRGSNLVLRVAARTFLLVGRKEEAIALARQAVDVDPLAAYSHAQLAYVYYNAQRFDSAIRAYRKVLELSPNFASGHEMISKCLLLTGRTNEALEEIELESDEQSKLETRCLIAYAQGHYEESNQLLNNYLTNYGERFPWIVACLYAYRNEPEKSIQWLGKSVAAKDSFLESTLVEPFFDKIRHTTSFQQILRELDFPDPNEQRP
jgi:tetratricopeptide (TPR) repeat protein